MLTESKIFSSFSVNDIAVAKKFYGETLGLKVKDKIRKGCEPMLGISLPEGGEVLVYPKKDHQPASFTVLNFNVSDIEKEVSDLASKGIQFEKYEGVDDKGIMHDEGPLVAWFKDPAGNFISVMKEIGATSSLDVDITRVLPIKSSELFKFFIEPELIEKWAYPDGFSLKIPQLEARQGGAYLWEHTNENGTFTCFGHFKEFKPGQKLVQLDEAIRGPDGKVLFENLECAFTFKDHDEGSEINIRQSGFKQDKDRRECEESWHQCLRRLESLLTRSRSSNQPKDKGGLEAINSIY